MGAADLAAAFVSAIDAQQLDELGALFSDDAVFVNILGMPMLGREGIVEGHRHAYAGPLRYSTVAMLDVTEVAAGEDLSIAHAQIRRGRVADAPAGGLPPGDTILLLTARRDGGDWVLVAAANVAVAPPPGG